MPESETICAALKVGNDLLGQHREICIEDVCSVVAGCKLACLQAIDLLDKLPNPAHGTRNAWPPAVSDEIERGVQLIEE